MTRNKALALYLSGTLGQIIIVCIAVSILRRCGMTVDFSTPLGLIAVALGGTSSAVWGCIVSIKYRRIKFIQIVKDFFNAKQSISAYLLMVLFLILDFLPNICCGGFNINTWYQPIMMFLMALVLGGIEEIGWRYLFQPALQEKQNYILSTMITFFCWGIWHYLYFYIDGSLPKIQFIAFYTGLLVNCFILSALFIKTKSLWICVMTHALINTFSQTAAGANKYINILRIAVIIALAVFISYKNDKTSDAKE